MDVNSEFQIFKKVKQYLEGLGYPSESIFFQYSIENKTRIDVVVKKEEAILIAIEVKNRDLLNIASIHDIEYHPLTRRIQKDAYEAGADYFVLSDGKEYLWMKTGFSGRPEKIEEVRFSGFKVFQNTDK
jgi:hypothetical protein